MAAVNLEELTSDAKKLSFWQAHRFWVMILAALGVALFLVLVAMNLYDSSGTAQLDLSRPEYENVRDKVGTGAETEAYPAVGELDATALDNFRDLFNDKAKKLRDGLYYAPSAMTDEALGLPSIEN